MFNDKPYANAVLGYTERRLAEKYGPTDEAAPACGVANPGGTPCSKSKGHAEGHDPESYGPAPAPDAGGEWRVHKNKRDIVTSDDKYVAFATTDEHAAQIVSNHNAVPKLVEALRRRVSPTKCYCDVMLGAKCGECADRELLTALSTLKSK